jgi:hypothetical protein
VSVQIEHAPLPVLSYEEPSTPIEDPASASALVLVGGIIFGSTGCGGFLAGQLYALLEQNQAAVGVQTLSKVLVSLASFLCYAAIAGVSAAALLRSFSNLTLRITLMSASFALIVLFIVSFNLNLPIKWRRELLLYSLAYAPIVILWPCSMLLMLRDITARDIGAMRRWMFAAVCALATAWVATQITRLLFMSAVAGFATASSRMVTPFTVACFLIAVALAIVSAIQTVLSSGSIWRLTMVLSLLFIGAELGETNPWNAIQSPSRVIQSLAQVLYLARTVTPVIVLLLWNRAVRIRDVLK